MGCLEILERLSKISQSVESRQFSVHPGSETTHQSSAYSVNKPEGHLTLDMSE